MGTADACTVTGCDRPTKARTWCRIHYLRWYNHGDPSWTPPTPDERFHGKVNRSGGPKACWPWTGYVEDVGYGRVNRNGPK